jgi:hypothetical protein
MTRLVHLYPAAWRERYGAELAALLEERPPSIADRLDIIRGAIDARLHAQVPGRHIPIGHRLPGAAAAVAGLLVCVAFVGITFAEPGSDWGGFGTMLAMAMILGLLSLPGTYFERYARQLKWGFGLGAGLAVLGAVLPWPLMTVPHLALNLLIFAGTLALAAARAGISARTRWLLVSLAFVPEALIAMGLYGMGAGLNERNGILVILALVLPYGLAWVAVGVRLMVRGSPTFDDDPMATAPSAAVAS